MKKCPYCQKMIDDKTKICKFCREVTDLNFPIYAKDLVLSDACFSYKGKDYRYDEVTNLYFISEQRSINLIPNAEVWFKIRTVSGDTINLYNTGVTTSGKRITNIGTIYSLIRIRSINSRLAFYAKQLHEKNYFDYKCGYEDAIKKIEGLVGLGSWDSGVVRFHNNGILEKGNKRLDLLVAKRKNLIMFGTNWGSILRGRKNPYEILLSETGFGVLDRKFTFCAYWDHDIIRFIIETLADGKTF